MSGLAPTATCAPCPPKVCAPQCEIGFNCRLSVPDSQCACPVASCVKLGFDTGADGDDPGTPPPSKPSAVGPVVGAIAGLGVVALIAFLVIRRRRRQRRMRRVSNIMSGHDESLDSFSKRWHSNSSSELGHKDVIRIAYIPSMIGESPIAAPDPTVNLGGAPQPRFAPTRDEDRAKHDSVASHMSGILDEAVVMAVTSKATPQVMRLNTIKATQSDLIQRSNTLHSSNSIKRSKSQRRLADAKNNTKPSPLAGSAHQNAESDSEQEADSDNQSQDTRVIGRGARRPSAVSTSGSDHANNPFMSQAELSAGAGAGSSLSPSLKPSHDPNANFRNSSSSPTPSHRSSNPFLSQSETAAAYSSDRNTAYSSAPSSPMSDSATVFASIPITLGDHHYDPSSPLSDLPEPNLRPWTNSGSTTMRDSTFSTMSDARSSTRGDGEEIMIFWDGNRDRDSKASNM
ncbi:hypothetical protein EC968_008542 [Mortierella alpina]|nr:hypothetical protein EC968_008542 [Mortierella alpina]